MFQVLFKGELTGTSMLAHGDPPMGVVFGSLKFQWTPDSVPDHLRSRGAKPRDDILTIFDDDNLVVADPAGQRLPCVGCGLRYHPQSEEAEIEVLGIPYEAYRRLFPAQWTAYFGTKP